MKLTPLRLFALKLALFSGMLGYMAVDLFVWHGPLWRAMYTDPQQAAAASPWVMQVYGERISPEQFERYVAEQNWLQGRTESNEAQRVVMLMDMARSNILRMRARYNDKNLPDTAAEAAQEVERLATRAKSPEVFDSWLASQGMTRELFTRKLQAILKARDLLERTVAPLAQVSDDDVDKHYELLKDHLTAPAHRPVKHIFLATLGKDAAAVQAQARQILHQLEAGADFAALARAHSEDDRTAPLGGDLGEVQDDEHFPLPELHLFGEQAIPAGKLTLAQSRWGWHILLPGEISPARALALDDVRESLRTAIQSAQYELAVKVYFDTAVRESFHKNHLRLNHAK